MMSPAEQQEFAALKAQVETLLSLLAAAGEYAGVDLTVSQPEPTGQILDFPAGRVPRKRAAGGAPRVTPFVGAPCRASTPGVAS